jgi:hypothetical protein
VATHELDSQTTAYHCVPVPLKTCGSICKLKLCWCAPSPAKTAGGFKRRNLPVKEFRCLSTLIGIQCKRRIAHTRYLPARSMPLDFRRRHPGVARTA